MPRPMKTGEPAGEACLAPTPVQAHVTDPLQMQLFGGDP